MNTGVVPAASARPVSTQGGARSGLRTQQSSPLISIIVVAFQDRDEVEILINNISPFRGSAVELLIVDGKSSDGTLELLQERNAVVDYWVSEPDLGVYDAMNKGIASAHGQYLLHLNAGDKLLLSPTPELLACLQDNIDVASFRVQLDDGLIFKPKDRTYMRIANAWHHQGTFYRRTAHLGYDPVYRVFGDFDHNQRLANTSASVRLFDLIISSHERPGLSASKLHFREVYRSIRRNSGALYVPLAFVLFKIGATLRHLSRFERRLECKVGLDVS